MEASTTEDRSKNPSLKRYPPPPRPDSLQPWRFFDAFAEGSEYARAIILSWAGPVLTRQQPGGHIEREYFPQPASPVCGAKLRDEELRQVWARWVLERHPEDGSTLMQSLRPIAWTIAKGLLERDVADLVQTSLVEVLEGDSAPYESPWNYMQSIVIRTHNRSLRRHYDGPKQRGGRRVYFASYEDPTVGGKTGELHNTWSEEIEFHKLSARAIADPRLRAVVELLQAGMPRSEVKAEVARRFDTSIRTVERIIEEHIRPKAAVIPALEACAFKLRVIIQLTPAQRDLLHTMQSSDMAA